MQQERALAEQALSYPGAPVLLVAMTRGEQEGDVRVQQYDDTRLRVASFLPGIVVELPGDTAKVEPEISQWVNSYEEAETVFLRYCEQARSAGWSDCDG